MACIAYDCIQSLAKCEQDESSDDDCVVAAIASAVSNIKAQSVNWYTKYRSRWKKCKARVASREKANTDSKLPDRDASRKVPAHEKMAAGTDSITTTSSSSSVTMESIPSLPADNLITSDKTDTNSAQISATDLTRDPEVLALLDKYSSELVAMVKQKL